MAMPASNLELALRGLPLAEPSPGLEAAIGRALHIALPEALLSEKSVECLVATELRACVPATPSERLEERLEDLAEVELHLRSLKPAPLRSDLESELEIELTEDLAFETWLSTVRPSVESEALEKVIGTQMGLHTLKEEEIAIGISEVPLLQLVASHEQKAAVVSTKVRWSAVFFATVGLAAALVVSVQTGVLDTPLYRPSGATADLTRKETSGSEFLKKPPSFTVKKGDSSAALSVNKSTVGEASGGLGEVNPNWRLAERVPEIKRAAISRAVAPESATEDAERLSPQPVRSLNEVALASSTRGVLARTAAVTEPGAKPKPETRPDQKLDPTAEPSILQAIASGDLANVLPPELLTALTTQPVLVASVPSTSLRNTLEPKLTANTSKGEAGLVFSNSAPTNNGPSSTIGSPDGVTGRANGQEIAAVGNPALTTSLGDAKEGVPVVVPPIERTYIIEDKDDVIMITGVPGNWIAEHTELKTGNTKISEVFSNETGLTDFVKRETNTQEPEKGD